MKRMKALKLMISFIAIMISPFVVANIVNAYQINTVLDGHPVNVVADIFIDPLADVITVTLNNLTINPTSIIQNLSGFGFALNATTMPPLLLSSSSSIRGVATDGSYTQSGPTDTGWALATGVVFPFGTGYQLYALGTQPNPADRTLIGQPDGSNFYSNANGSIAGNGPHNPFIYGPATFVLDFSAVTDLLPDNYITGVAWSFGTGPTTVVPEPATIFLLGGGLLGLLGLRRKFQK